MNDQPRDHFLFWALVGCCVYVLWLVLISFGVI